MITNKNLRLRQINENYKQSRTMRLGADVHEYKIFWRDRGG